MDVVSICLIVFFVIFMLIGYIKGFLGILLSVCKGLASIIISYFLAKPFGELLYKMGLGNLIGGKLETTFTNATPLANEIITSETQNEVFSNALTELNIPEFLHKIITNLIGKGNITEGETLGHYIAHAVAMLACTVISFVILVIALKVILFIFRKIFSGISKMPVFGQLNRILGLAVNFLYAWLIISAIFWAVALISTFIPEVGEFVTNIFKLNEEPMTIAKWLYEHNLATMLYEYFVK